MTQPTTPKHTPGKWRIGKYNNEVAVYADGTLKIALVESWIGEKEKAESEANAALIASAPELFAALTGLLVAVCDANCIGSTVADEQIESARAAIASARRGES